MNSDQTLHDLQRLLMRNERLRRTLQERGAVTILQQGKTELRAVRENDDEISIIMTAGPQGVEFKIKAEEDSFQIVERDSDGNSVTTSYHHGNLGAIFGTAAYVDIIEAALRGEGLEEMPAQEMKYAEFALVSQDPRFFNVYNILVNKKFAKALEINGFEIKNIRTFTEPERVARSTSEADSYIVLVDANLETILSNPGTIEYFRSYGGIPKYDYPMRRFKTNCQKNGSKSYTVLVQEKPLLKDMVIYAGYDALVNRIRALS